MLIFTIRTTLEIQGLPFEANLADAQFRQTYLTQFQSLTGQPHRERSIGTRTRKPERVVSDTVALDSIPRRLRLAIAPASPVAESAPIVSDTITVGADALAC